MIVKESPFFCSCVHFLFSFWKTGQLDRASNGLIPRILSAFPNAVMLSGGAALAAVLSVSLHGQSGEYIHERASVQT
jgi:hypothetical protein